MENIKRKVNVLREEGFSFSSFLATLAIVMILSSIFGFIYEEIFYRIDLGYFVKRGSTYGPWIPIYFFGGGLIFLISYKFRKKPLLVFLINCIVTGVLEYGTGYVLNEFFGIRLWDYNNEILNFGNIGGYICLRSVLLFGFGCLFLIYKLIPFLDKINSSNRKFINILSYILFSLFIFDILLSLIF